MPTIFSEVFGYSSIAHAHGYPCLTAMMYGVAAC
jgi:hypothetical protein